ncbi:MULTISPECIES: DUF3783 domain-containing protein [Clostridium]|jgi:hypothetical protein|uniref:DUF3783 domain-containing protein n=2 Tax=root TaxID=1 RepID=R9CDA9_9CLOT|nr:MULTISPECIES: DUF3783 domain-containing protein [Clostridium]EOR27253.1 hypothetical protein A500_05541 [Clostridium sartagoforme AAU1]KLE15089.1 hypothetical protein AAT22_13245 [Clostridium sp. C8]
MSFEKLDMKDTEVRDGRSCIILCNFNAKEVKTISNLAGMFGIKDKIILNYKNGNSIVKDILENNILSDSEDGVKNKAIIFNNIPGAKMGTFIENIKKFRINNVLKATVTETSREWTVNFLLKNLVAERIAMKSGKDFNHDEE